MDFGSCRAASARVALIVLLAVGPASGQGVRERIRTTRPAGTVVSDAQAAELTLTLTTASPRPVQTWIRTAGTIDKAGKTLTASLSGAEAALVQAGQRVRAFSPSSKSSMNQARITRVIPRAGGAVIEATLASAPRLGDPHYVMEIVVERGPFLSVPNETIIEEGEQQIVYVLKNPGQYVPQAIHTGIQGELYTQVLDGLNDGDQVVTFGSFFIDAEHKLKGTDQVPTAR